MINQKEKAKEILKKYKFKWISFLHLNFFIWLMAGNNSYLKCVKNELKKL